YAARARRPDWSGGRSGTGRMASNRSPSLRAPRRSRSFWRSRTSPRGGRSLYGGSASPGSRGKAGRSAVVTSSSPEPPPPTDGGGTDRATGASVPRFPLARRVAEPAVVLAAIAITAVGLDLLSNFRQANFATSTWDLGIYQQALWSTAHGRPFY